MFPASSTILKDGSWPFRSYHIVDFNLLFDAIKWGDTSWLTAETDSWLVECVYQRELNTVFQFPDHYCTDSGSVLFCSYSHLFDRSGCSCCPLSSWLSARSAMHDGLYLSVGDHRLCTTFQMHCEKQWVHCIGGKKNYFNKASKKTLCKPDLSLPGSVFLFGWRLTHPLHQPYSSWIFCLTHAQGCFFTSVDVPLCLSFVVGKVVHSWYFIVLFWVVFFAENSSLQSWK